MLFPSLICKLLDLPKEVLSGQKLTVKLVGGEERSFWINPKLYLI